MFVPIRWADKSQDCDFAVEPVPEYVAPSVALPGLCDGGKRTMSILLHNDGVEDLILEQGDVVAAATEATAPVEGLSLASRVLVRWKRLLLALSVGVIMIRTPGDLLGLGSGLPPHLVLPLLPRAPLRPGRAGDELHDRLS